MKKTLHAFMLINLAIGCTQAYGKIVKQDHEEGVTEYVDSVENTEKTTDLLKELEQSNPEVIEQIILNEQDLEATFSSIKNYIHKLTKQMEENDIKQIELARLTIELADTQAAFNKAIARYETKHKKSPKIKQTIQQALTKAEKTLVQLSLQTQTNLQQAKSYVEKQIKHKKSTKKSSEPKTQKIMVADIAFEMPIEE